jgi:hypothetical protein
MPWLESEIFDIKIILQLRHPSEVVRSLAARSADAVDESIGIRLWLRHVFESERSSRVFPRMIVVFDRLLGDAPYVLSKCMNFVGHSESFVHYKAAEFVSSNLSRYRMAQGPSIPSSGRLLLAEREIAHELYSFLLECDVSDQSFEKHLDDLYRSWIMID